MRIEAGKTALDFLNEASAILQERGEQRNLPGGERSMARTVALFNVLLQRDLTEFEGWMFMKCLKMTRAVVGEFQPDDLLDDMNFTALALEHQARLQACTQPTNT